MCSVEPVAEKLKDKKRFKKYDSVPWDNSREKNCNAVYDLRVKRKHIAEEWCCLVSCIRESHMKVLLGVESSEWTKTR
jgi:hypothetical protein